MDSSLWTIFHQLRDAVGGGIYMSKKAGGGEEKMLRVGTAYSLSEGRFYAQNQVFPTSLLKRFSSPTEEVNERGDK